MNKAATIFILAAILTIVQNTPCLQNEWDKTTGKCYITNVCNHSIYGYALCDSDASMCGSSKSNGVAMCGNSKFYIGECHHQCQGLTWYKSDSPHCNVDGKCCEPRVIC
eukprot:TRINITY_DN12427_c0_g1_i1.p1 TRINITY_DN12427_c0_g1~~TRINITY_DN12427_c0_g1_i1.p1  ORF type:complete len:109 (+),score=12.57 TRINITY_DN12427_c0_g1_i1:35-361(+)